MPHEGLVERVRAARRAKIRPPSPSEHDWQVALLEYLSMLRKNLYCFAIPNAGQRSFQAARRMKAEGLRAGVADVCVMMGNGGTVWLELKSKKGRSTDEQKGFSAICKALEHNYAVVHSFDEALEALRKFGAIS